jgi:hypothetical protein
MWSNMTYLLVEVRLETAREPILENLALARAASRKRRGETPAARWNVRTKFERSAKPTSSATSVILRSRVREQARRAAQPRAHEVLVRRHAERAREHAQEVERRERDRARRALEIDVLVRVLVEPARASIARRRSAVAHRRRRALDAATAPRRSAPRTRAHLVETEVGALLGGRLRELAEHHELGQRRQRARAPELAAARRASRRARGERERRHSSPPAAWSCGTMYSSPGWPTSTDPATSSYDWPRVSMPKLPRRTYEIVCAPCSSR